MLLDSDSLVVGDMKACREETKDQRASEGLAVPGGVCTGSKFLSFGKIPRTIQLLMK